MTITRLINGIARKFGFNIVPCSARENYAADVPASLIETYEKVKPYTMTSSARVFALCDAVKYIHDKNIEGDIVECGVWKGGSMMAVAETLLRSCDASRNLYLFDTFEGMSPPTDKDVDFWGKTAESLLGHSDAKVADLFWCRATMELVKSAIDSVGYPSEKIHLCKGMVEQTIPLSAPDKISLLRLDTDWYESTKHEMEHLFPRLSKGGVLIIDDYGHWQGARKAVDEFLEKHNVKILLNRIDYSGRIAVKVE